MSVEKIKSLSLNPYFLGKIIQNFLQGYSKPCDLKLLFYVLPIIMYKESRDKLITAKSTSSMETLFTFKSTHKINESTSVSGKIGLTGFVERFNYLKTYTKQTIIILANQNKIKLGNQFELIINDKYDKYKGDMSRFLRAAFYLGVIFEKTNIECLDEFLGVYNK